MKLTHISAKNVLGARQIEAPIETPVTVFCGSNYAGKTSIFEAVRMALGQNTVRVSKKLDYAKLVTEGAKNGEVVVRFDGGQAWFMVPSGKMSPPKEYLPPDGIPFALDAQRFARLDPKERRGFLFSLMGLQIDNKSTAGRLAARGCDATCIAEIMPFLVGGFDVGASEAAGRARDAKAAWNTLTGEAYGSQKAVDWRAPVGGTLPDDIPPMGELRNMQTVTERGIGELQQQLGAHQSDSRRVAEAIEKLPALRAKVDMLPRIRTKLELDEKGLIEWQERVAETRAAEKATAGINCDCPECGASLRFIGGKLQARGAAGDVDTTNVLRLPDYERALVISQNAAAASRRDLADAEAAEKELATLEELVDKAPPSLATADELHQAIAGARAKLAEIQAHIAQHNEAGNAAARADKLTEDAAARHLAVQRWDAVAKALSPDGIPAEILGEALDPINDLLAAAAVEADWPHVRVEADMSITWQDGRPYALLSESEQWRADAMLAAAISQLSGVKLLLLDRFDLLDGKGRSDLFYWVEGLAESGAVETVLLFGTLKAQPSDLPPTFRSYWIADGKVVGQAVAA